MNIKLFASRSVKGKELASLLSERLPKVIQSLLQDEAINFDVIYPGDFKFGQLFFYSYEKKDDLVLFDASIEDNGGAIKLGENYACAPHAPYMTENVLVVSRTVLPLNFIPHTTNVLPFGEDYIYVGKDLHFVRSYDNQDIVTWVIERIKERFYDGRLLKRFIKKESLIKSPVKKDPNLYIHDGRKVAFVSYRSYYNEPNKCGQCSVQDLEHIILDYHKTVNPNETWRVLYYPPGSLSQDCPTEDLRWSLMCYVENVFIHVDEVWIFNSEKEDDYSYWDSWFTQGEFISLMIINQGLNKYLPKVYMFNPHDKSFKELKDLPLLSEKARTELGALTANSDNLWGDRAAMKKIIWTFEHKAELSLFKRVKLKVNGFLNKKLLNVASYSEMEKLHAYNLSFLTSRVFSCKKCAKKGNCMDDFRNDSFIHDFINIGDDLEPQASHNIENGIFVVNKEDFKKSIEQGYVECPNCHNKIKIKHAPEQSFYLWQRYIPNNPYGNTLIEKIEAYNVI